MNSSVIVIALAALVSGCMSPMKNSAPDGWPDLQIVEHVDADPKTVEELCGHNAVACAYVDLCASTCSTYYKPGRYTPAIREHERLHCRGRDHWFSNVLETLFNKWRSGELCKGAVTKKDHADADAAFLLLLLL